MAIAPGARIGVYEVVSLIGSGGMGEVYLARDTQLGRNVALKVLPDIFASDAERLARFRREAQVLAGLHHPNIAVIHGLEDGPAAASADAASAAKEAGPHVRALVLEYIEGDTLADRIAAERIPLDEALGIARQIAEALQAAHDQGVIHRDLKPSNIKLTPDGAVKVLDFGLAKLNDSNLLNDSNRSNALSLSPTITSPAATMMGVILGTAAYMAPEQAKGKPADKRSDVWAFGCVLFEMLTAKRAFEGDDISETLASVIKGEPEWAALYANVPLPVRTLLRSCLTKDPRARLADIAGAMFVLRNSDALVAAAQPATSAERGWSWLVAAGVLLLAVAVAASGWFGWTLRPDDPLRSLVTTYPITLPEGQGFTNINRRLVAVSPDSALVAYVTGVGGVARVNVRSAGSLESRSLKGTEGAPGVTAPRGPFFSPDSQWIGFWTSNQLKRISVNDSAAQVLATVSTSEQPTGSYWAEDKTILFSGSSGIWRVSENGGTPELLVKADDTRRMLQPQLLPGGRALLFTALPIDPSGGDQADIIVRLLDGGVEHRIAGGTDARYASTGHVVFVVRGALTAIAFDAKSLTTSGGPIPLLEGVVESPSQNGTAHFDLSRSGTLAYVRSALTLIGRTPVWRDRQNRETLLGPEARPYLYLRLSPDDSRVAFDVGGEGDRDIWVWDVAPRAMRPLTTDVLPDRAPLFTLDGLRIVYTVNSRGGTAVVSRSADGVGPIEELLKADVGEQIVPLSFAPDGALILRYSKSDAGVDLFTLPAGQGSKPKPLIAESFREDNAAISHNGKWIAYQTNPSGRDEVVVRPWPAFNTHQWPVSTAGGSEPLWSSDDSELFFRSPSGAIMRVSVTPRGDAWDNSAAQQVIPGDGLFVGTLGRPLRTYDVSRDGRRFLVLKDTPVTPAKSQGPNIVVVQNYSEELKRRVPVK